MKALLLLGSIGIVGFFVYRAYFAAPEPVAAAPVLATPTPTPVPFAIRSAVGRLYEEWKRRELGEQSTAMSAPKQLLTDIRRNLFGKGEHTDAAVERVVRQALSEMGIPSGEQERVGQGIMSMH